MLKVLFVASEAVPFIKTGGLADVVGTLPKELRRQGVDARVILPKYGMIKEMYKEQMKPVWQNSIPVAWRQKYVGIEEMNLDGMPVYFVDNEEYFKRDGVYGYDDDAERFSFFSRAVLNALPALDFMPDIIHLNDWHTAMVSVFLKLEHMHDERYQKMRTIFTIHNLKYQGVFPKEIMTDVLGLDWKYYRNGDLEFYGAVNFMKAGLIYADAITTVSPTYAKEIQYEYFGEKLEGLLQKRANRMEGILNGLDYEEYNPITDSHIFVPYDAFTPEKKRDNKVRLQKVLDLPVRRDVPMLALVSRLVPPKGLDLIVRIADELLRHEKVQLVVLGTGDQEYEDWFKGLAWRFPNKTSINICFDDTLAHQIYAAADMFLMPSNYEPCGIGQLIALRYGCVPIVRETGGLKDTIKPYDKYTNNGNGFTFVNYNAHELLYAIKKALGEYEDMNVWNTIIRNAMRADYSWSESARQYRDLYTGLLR